MYVDYKTKERENAKNNNYRTYLKNKPTIISNIDKCSSV